MKNFLPGFCLSVLALQVFAQNLPVGIIPRPAQLQENSGFFEINGHTAIFASQKDSAAWNTGKSLARQVYDLTGLSLQEINADVTNAAEDFIKISSKAQQDKGEEGYALTISPSSMTLDASTPTGLFYAWQSLEQLMPPEVVMGAIPRVSSPLRFQALEIEDKPRFGWRGMHLDVSRHFFSKDFIKKYLDYMAMLKLNVFHWHLTDSQGWRIEIKKYPRLTEAGAFRVQRPGEYFAGAAPQQPGEKANYGGFYTQDDVREIVAYAAARHITIVPEIDMPGHCMAALVAYPQFASIPDGIKMPSGRINAYSNSFNPGNDSTYTFLEDILTEVMDLFPGKYIHIGGDEVDRAIWKDNALCKEKMKKENLKSLDELQSYFTKRIEAFISSKGRKMIGWDEILEGGLAPGAAVMSWRGYRGGILAARAKHNVVMTPSQYAYFDLYQGDPKLEPEAYSKLTLSTAYLFDPPPVELSGEERNFILGGQGTLWTETIPDEAHVEHMLFPRALALSEAVWCQMERKNFDDFKDRLDNFLLRLRLMKVNYARSAYNVSLKPVRDTSENKMMLVCSNELNRGTIFYTTDGSQPSPQGILYKSPFEISGNTTIKAATFRGIELISEINSEEFQLSKTSSKQIHLSGGPSQRFAGYNSFSLTDGIKGTANPFDGRWLGFAGSGLNAVIDLGAIRDIKNIGLDFMEEKELSIYLPLALDIEISDDGRNYIRLIHYDEKDLLGMKTANIVKVYREFSAISMRYIRIATTNRYPGPADDGKVYILCDEISAN